MGFTLDELNELELEVREKDQQERSPLSWTGEELVIAE